MLTVCQYSTDVHTRYSVKKGSNSIATGSQTFTQFVMSPIFYETILRHSTFVEVHEAMHS